MAQRQGPATLPPGPPNADDDRYDGTASLLAADATRGGDAADYADVLYACSLASGTCRYRLHGDEWECAMANKHACMCKKKVDGEWAWVGTTSGLKGNRPRLYHNDHPT